MTTNTNDTRFPAGLSSCCGAYVEVGGSGSTYYYICSKCGCVCDAANDTGLPKVELDRFAEFKRYFTTYQKRFGLNGYKIYFKTEPLKDSFANIMINQEGMVATVSFDSSPLDKDKPFQDSHGNAKHEAIHLLLARINDYATSRFVTKCDCLEAEEELVRRLETLIPDIEEK